MKEYKNNEELIEHLISKNVVVALFYCYEYNIH